jgi:uncharacterized protein (UPF0276 family)
LSPKAWLAGSAPRRAGIGLRAAHHGDWIAQRPDVGWFEIHAENYFAEGGLLPDILDTLRRDLPLSIHGVGLGLASTDPLDESHLRQLARLQDRYQPAVVSEHLCWGAADGIHYNDLLPFPFTETTLAHVAARVQCIQEQLRRPILLENLSSYVTFEESSLGETEFLTELIGRTDCGLLLDLNNLVVNAANHGIDPERYVASLPADAIGEIHLAGHAYDRYGDRTLCLDTHDRPVPDRVWDLYRFTLRQLGAKPTLIEWDAKLPTLPILAAEAHRADACVAELL